MKRLLIASAILAIALSAPAMAQVPRTMSYQGVLTDNAGTPLPDGFYDMTFRIFSVPAGGSALYTEVHNGANQVKLKSGAFSVVIGSVTPMSLKFDGQYYLGIQLGIDPELAPRTPLGSSPYALGLALPFTCSTNIGARLLEGYDLSGFGGSLSGYTSAGARSFDLQPDIDGVAGYLQIHGGPGAFIVDGNSDGGPLLSIYGTASSMAFDTNVDGNASVLLPPSSIAAPEIRDEPGISQGRSNFFNVTSLSPNMVDVVTTTITIPSDGYVLLTAHSGARFNGTTNQNEIRAQIDETSGGFQDDNHFIDLGADGYVTTLYHYMPFSCTRTYFKAAGTYTFRLEAFHFGQGAATFLNTSLTAVFLPTSYGAVTTAATSSGPDARVERAGTSPADGMIDLRELELKAAKTREAAAAAERALLDARLRSQNRVRP